MATSLAGSGFDHSARSFLELVREAMRAEAAALLVRDAKTQETLIQCAAGSAELAAVVSLAAAGGAEAAGSEPAPRDLAPGDAGFVVGVRLPQGRLLSGVLSLGLTAERRFTGQEMGCLHTLAERLVFHLEHARRIADLEAEVMGLRSERELRERYVSSVAHDLRGPLAAAKMCAQALASRPERLDERRDLASKIDHNIDRTDRMIRDFLDASRIRAGERLSVTFADCEITAIARELVEELTAMHGERFVLEAPECLPGHLSAHELRRALWNLATNAVKYGAPDHPITITIGRRAREVLVSVHNRGAPIPPAEQARLFRPFSRLSATNGTRGGWGLGLTLVLGCAAAHGGSVRVQSDAESGTTFTLELPLDLRRYDARRDEPPLSQLGMH